MNPLRSSSPRLPSESIPGVRRPLRYLLALLLLIPGAISPQEPAPDAVPAAVAESDGTKTATEMPAATPLDADGDEAVSGAVVFIVPVHGDVNPVLDVVMARAIRQAARENAAAIVFDMDTFGGGLDSAIRIRDRLVTLDIPTFTFVNNKAISAGSLIALATDKIVMAPGSNIGAALPVTVGAEGLTAADEKMISVMASEMRKTAKAKNHPSDLAEAFCNPDFEIAGLKEKGDILTLDYDQAVDLGLAAYMAESLDDLLAAEGLSAARIERFQETPTDRFARWLVSPAVMGLLIAVGVGGLFIELKTPGVGLPGAVGLAALGVYFFGSYLATLSGYMELIAFFLGLVLLGLEIFVIPGFGIPGVAGILLMVGALFFAMFNRAPDGFDFHFARVEVPLWTLTMSLFATAPILWLAAWLLPKTPLYGHLTLAPPHREPSLAGGARGGMETEASFALRAGQRGRAITPLRPAGKALIDDHRVDVVSEGEFIDADTEIEIVAVQGSRVAVRSVPARR